MNISTTKQLFGKPYGLVKYTGEGESIIVDQVIPLRSAEFLRGIDASGNYTIWVKTESGHYGIPLAEVENQVSWANSEAGIQTAIEDLTDLAYEVNSISSATGTLPAPVSTPATKRLKVKSEDGTISIVKYYSGATFLYAEVYTYDSTGFETQCEIVTVDPDVQAE